MPTDALDLSSPQGTERARAKLDALQHRAMCVTCVEDSIAVNHLARAALAALEQRTRELDLYKAELPRTARERDNLQAALDGRAVSSSGVLTCPGYELVDFSVDKDNRFVKNSTRTRVVHCPNCVCEQSGEETPS